MDFLLKMKVAAAAAAAACCSLLYVKETAGGEGISPITLLPLIDGPSTPPQTALCIESAASSLLFHKE